MEYDARAYDVLEECRGLSSRIETQEVEVKWWSKARDVRMSPAAASALAFQ
jgi:hypothetical protein